MFFFLFYFDLINEQVQPNSFCNTHWWFFCRIMLLYSFDFICKQMCQGIQEWPKKICGRQPLKNLKWYGLPSRPYHFKFFKGCLLRILLRPFLNTFTQMCRALKLQMQTHGSNLGIDAYYSHKHWYRYPKTEHTFCQLNCNQNLPLLWNL